MTVRILSGDCRVVLPTMPTGSVQCCVTSPPYYGHRDYGVAEQVGQEKTPDAYVAELIAVFREVRRVLADDGTLWLNLGDSYGDKQLLMIPARVALALQADGWVLRSDIIWHKSNPMPESCTDRPASAHEHVFLFAKRDRYFYDADAIAEAAQQPLGAARKTGQIKSTISSTGGPRFSTLGSNQGAPTRNARNVWTIATQPYSGAHFATMPPALVERCILAGSRLGDTVLDPFGGAGTTGLVADRLGRSAVLIELNPAYAALGQKRIASDCPMFAEAVG